MQSLNRRRFLQSTALGAAALATPAVLRAQGAPIKVGILQPVSGAMSYSGQQGRLGATLALEEINAAGIKALGGAKIEPVFGDAQSTPEGGNAEVEKMNAAGVAAIASTRTNVPAFSTAFATTRMRAAGTPLSIRAALTAEPRAAAACVPVAGPVTSTTTDCPVASTFAAIAFSFASPVRMGGGGGGGGSDDEPVVLIPST